MHFVKAHGLGNDFLLVDAAQLAADRPALARRLCQRHTGAGADGMLLYDLAADPVAMRLYNADGGEAEISGNGLRCLAAHLVREGWQPACHSVHTAAGLRRVEVMPAGGARYRVTCELGMAILDSRSIPIALDPALDRVIRQQVDTSVGPVCITATSLGNPHCALFLEAPATDAMLQQLGPALEHHPLFPRRTNVEFVTVVSRQELRVRFWERGVGPTSASGTGAASAVVAAVLEGRTDRAVRVVCDGGVLEVEWQQAGEVRQTGEVEVLYSGEWNA